MAPVKNERGIALPVTIFIVTLLTITLAAAFARVNAEREIAVGTGDAVDALQIARSGLQRYMGTRTSRPPNGDSVRFNVTGGYADVRAWIVQRPADTTRPQMYAVRSKGYVIVPAAGAKPQGVRTVAQFGYWQTPLIRRIAAFTAANGITAVSPGDSIRVRGNDQCGVTPAIPSVRAAAGSTLSYGSYSGAGNVISGTGAQVSDTAGVLWATLIGGGFIPDYYSMSLGNFSWRSQLIVGNATLSNNWGTGLLIVTGDLTTSGPSALWYGIVLVGGRLISNSSHTHFNGMAITGLNAQLGGPAPPAETIGASGRDHIDYWSCYVNNALSPLRALVPVRNAYVDNWASY